MSAIESDLRRGLRWLVIATITLYVVLFMVGVYFFIDSNNRRAELEEVARNTNNTLCSLKADLERRLQSAQDFLEENPNGIPGISDEFIASSIANQQSTIDALSTLDCAQLREEQ